jgi:hypothetical protein
MNGLGDTIQVLEGVGETPFVAPQLSCSDELHQLFEQKQDVERRIASFKDRCLIRKD